MGTIDVSPAGTLTHRLARFAPGLPALLGYRRADFPHDLMAGLSVAAVALPVGVAYAQLAGFNPVVGLYVSILPLLAYALFGTSRQLVVGPDAATCALVAAAVTPLAGGDPALYLSLTMAMTALAGLLCIGASFLRLGALADFLSKPILVGFLNGISLYILAGQLGKLLGFSITAGGIVPKLLEVTKKIDQIHWPTLAVGLATLVTYVVSKRVLPRLPAPLVALVGSGLVVALLGLDAHGVAVVGAVPAGLPVFRLPSFSLDQLEAVAGAAAGLALITFTSMMLTARSFAAKNHYEIDADREMAALGAANIAAALSQGFAISGASGLVCFRFAVAAALTGTFSLGDAALTFLWLALAGIAVGVGLTVAVSAAHHLLAARIGEESGSTVLVNLLLPFGAYQAAELLEASGILAAVAAGITMSHVELRGSALAITRIRQNAVWNTVQFALNGVMFVLLGEQLPSNVTAALNAPEVPAAHDVWWLAGNVLAISLGLILLRFIWVWVSLRLTLLAARRQQQAVNRPNPRLILAASLAGVRGAVTLAGVLTLPLALPGGAPFPGRDLVIFLASAAIMVSLVLASVVLPRVLRGLELPAEAVHESEEDRARHACAQAAARPPA